MERVKILAIIVIVLVIIIGFLAFLISSFQKDGKTDNSNGSANKDDQSQTGCTLMKNDKGEVNCFGCSSGIHGPPICKAPTPDYTPFQIARNNIQIPYACYEGEEGCMLAQ